MKYKLVPVNPTREMLAAASAAVVALNSQHHDAISEAVYKAMLAASSAEQEEMVAQSDREAWLASLFPEDRMFEEIKSMAARTYRRHCTRTKGRQVSAADGIEHHWIWATKRWIEINEPSKATDPEEQQSAQDVAALVEALEGILAIVSDSSGVAGYHLNGDIAKWCEFEEVETAEEALELYRKQGSSK